MASKIETKIVKQIIAGDGLILRDRPVSGPPKELTVYLTHLSTPKLAKYKDPDSKTDDPWAWEAREFLRKLLVGKEVQFREDFKFSGRDTVSGTIFLDGESDSINLLLVKEGFSEVSKRKQVPDSEEIELLLKAEADAKAANKRRWSNEISLPRAEIVNDLSADVAEKLEGLKLNGIVEHVKDGSSYKIGVFLPLNKPEKERTIYQLLPVNLAGIKCPSINEEYGEEAKFFAESRLLHTDIVLYVRKVQTTNFVFLIGNILSGERNIALYLLKEGFAKTVDRTISFVHGGIDKYREAERSAKKNQLRLWKNFAISDTRLDTNKNVFQAEVIEISNAEAIVVEKVSDKTQLKIWLSSIRGPRADKDINTGTKIIPLYDIPLMIDAREFLRKKLLGKIVNVRIDYEQPKIDPFPEKYFGTVHLNEINIAATLVLKGFASVVKRNDDEQKSFCFDELLEAESKAQKAQKGIFAKNSKVKRLKPVIISGDSNRAAFQLESLSRGPPKEAIVEYIFSLTKLKCFLPKENTLINFIIGGVQVEKSSKTDDSVKLIKRFLHQRDVFLTFEKVDKAGNFIGNLKFENSGGKQISLAYYLIREGLCKIRDDKDQQLVQAQNEAQAERKGIWQNYVEEEHGFDEEDDKEIDIELTSEDLKKDFVDLIEAKGLKKVVVSLIQKDALHLYVQKVENGLILNDLLVNLRRDLTNNPPLPGAYRPKPGDICAAIFRDDGLYYRAKIEKINPADKTVDVIYIDHGDKATVKYVNEVCALPNPIYNINALNPVAQLYGLAYVYLPKNDTDAVDDARVELELRLGNGKEFLLKNEYKLNNLEYITLIDLETKEDVILNLVREGFYCVDSKPNYGRNKKLTTKQYAKYREAMETALVERLNLWRYGDIREDDVREFDL